MRVPGPRVPRKLTPSATGTNCNRKHRRIRINSELVKKPKELLEYIVVHEILHLLAPTHSDEFRMLLDKHFPAWHEARAELNELPIAGEF
jgi:predicted metal-dependent hydrolase